MVLIKWQGYFESNKLNMVALLVAKPTQLNSNNRQKSANPQKTVISEIILQFLNPHRFRGNNSVYCFIFLFF